MANKPIESAIATESAFTIGRRHERNCSQLSAFAWQSSTAIGFTGKQGDYHARVAQTELTKMRFLPLLLIAALMLTMIPSAAADAGNDAASSSSAMCGLMHETSCWAAQFYCAVVAAKPGSCTCMGIILDPLMCP